MSSPYIEDLKVLPCLAQFTEKELEIIGEGLEVKTLKKNNPVFYESEPVRDIFIVKDGSVKLYKSSPDGKELVIRVMKEGDHFCCAAALSGERYFVNAIANEDATIITLPVSLFKKRLFASIDPLTMKLIKGLCGRIRYLSCIVEDLTFLNVEQRVGHFLLMVSHETSADDEVELSLTHQEIAGMVGTVREVVSRVMSKLKKEGVILKSTVKGFRISKNRLCRYLSEESAV